MRVIAAAVVLAPLLSACCSRCPSCPQPTAQTAPGKVLYTADADGRWYVSRDGGETWVSTNKGLVFAGRDFVTTSNEAPWSAPSTSRVNEEFFGPGDGARWAVSGNPFYDAARKEWLAEIEAAEKATAECLLAAGREPDARVREQRKAECAERFRTRARLNDERFERAKATIEAVHPGPPSDPYVPVGPIPAPR